MSEKNITLLSTHALDRLVDALTGKTSEQQGGPAYFIENVLKKEGVSYELIPGPEMIVEILINESGEFGKISQQVSALKLDFSKITTPFVLISTLLDEFDLSGLPAYQGLAFLDIQGYVRDGMDFGRKKNWNPAPEIFQSIFCLKATEQEIGYIPEDLVKKQKEKVLLVTKGKRGLDLYFQNEKFSLIPKRIIQSANTIGAGDTFFSCFACAYARTQDAIKSCEYALAKTAEFLETIS